MNLKNIIKWHLITLVAGIAIFVLYAKFGYPPCDRTLDSECVGTGVAFIFLYLFIGLPFVALCLISFAVFSLIYLIKTRKTTQGSKMP